MDSSFIQETQTQKYNNFISKCNWFINFQDLKNPNQESSKRSQLILKSIDFEKLLGKNDLGYSKSNLDNKLEASNMLVNINHKLFNEVMKSKDKESRQMSLIVYDKCPLVNLEKKNDLLVKNSYCNMGADSSSMKVVAGDVRAMGTPRTRLPFHIASIQKPQLEYNMTVNNMNQPFQHVWLEISADGSRVIHPLKRFTVSIFVDKNVRSIVPRKPPLVEGTPFKLVQDVNALKELVAKLRKTHEFAVDLEHNQYRSYQGLTCLMQISTRTEDFIVDTLKLRVQIGPYMREIFKDPTKRKVMHGADKDILWLQRDFSIYVCNMFDTGQASRVLNMERNSLDHLLQHFCGVTANKEYQTADWRFRPLSNEMLRYAREDTHYLLYIYDLMRIMLLSLAPDRNYPDSLLVDVYQRSYDVCMQLYQKFIFNEYSYLNIFGLHAADLNGRQLSIVAALCELRDIVARAEDESTGYVLPNKTLIEIAKKMPTTSGELCGLVRYMTDPFQKSIESILNIIKNSVKNAASFEPVAKQLKLIHMEMEAALIEQKMFEEASLMSIGSRNFVTNQSANAAVGLRKFDLNTKVMNEQPRMNLKFEFGSFGISGTFGQQNLSPFYPSPRFQKPFHMPNHMKTVNQNEGCSWWSSRVEPEKRSMNKSATISETQARTGSATISGTRFRTGGPYQNV